MGWRLGGKGASSCNKALGNRVEEHGLHLWFGFYENAFDLMRRTYAAMDPPQAIEDHFTPVEEIVLGEDFHGRSVLREIHPPPKDGEPGVGDHAVDFWSVAETALAWLLDLEVRATTPESILRRVHSSASAAAHFALGLPRLVLGSGIGPGSVRRDVSRGLSSLASAVSPGAAPGPASEEYLRQRVAEVLGSERGDTRGVLELAYELSARRHRRRGSRRQGLQRDRRPRPARLAPAARRARAHDAARALHPRALRPRLRLPRRRHGQAGPGRREGDPGPHPDRLQLQGRADVPARRRHGRDHLQPPLPRAVRPRGAVPLLPSRDEPRGRR